MLIPYIDLYIDILQLTHSWYDQYCCNTNDCFQINCAQLKTLSNGAISYATEFYEFIFHKNTFRFSQDAACHVCIWGGQPRCLYLLPAT